MSEQTKHDGGPAFPEQGARGKVTGGEGMSLRAYFAAKAMQGLLSNDAHGYESVGSAEKRLGSKPGEYNSNRDYPRLVAMDAVGFADALIARLNSTQPQDEEQPAEQQARELEALWETVKIENRRACEAEQEVRERDVNEHRTDLVEEINKLTEKLLDSGPGPEKRFRKKKTTSSNVDCDFYYFSPYGKWKYHGEGMFPRPTDKGWHEVSYDTVYQENRGMPGILGNGKSYILLVVPKENCQAKYAYPRLIFPDE